VRGFTSSAFRFLCTKRRDPYDRSAQAAAQAVKVFLFITPSDDSYITCSIYGTREAAEAQMAKHEEKKRVYGEWLRGDSKPPCPDRVCGTCFIVERDVLI
jgi:hypothetical protein